MECLKELTPHHSSRPRHVAAGSLGVVHLDNLDADHSSLDRVRPGSTNRSVEVDDHSHHHNDLEDGRTFSRSTGNSCLPEVVSVKIGQEAM